MEVIFLTFFQRQDSQEMFASQWESGDVCFSVGNAKDTSLNVELQQLPSKDCPQGLVRNIAIQWVIRFDIGSGETE